MYGKEQHEPFFFFNSPFTEIIYEMIIFSLKKTTHIVNRENIVTALVLQCFPPIYNIYINMFYFKLFINLHDTHFSSLR